MADRDKTSAPPGAPRKVQADERGRSVWVDTIRTAQFELVSTQTLQTLLDAEEQKGRDEIERIAAGADDGYLARDSATGHFRIIDDEALQAILDQHAGEMDRISARQKSARKEPPPSASAQDELSLVSTQALRQLLGTPEPEQPGKKKESSGEDEAGGFNPYDHG